MIDSQFLAARVRFSDDACRVETRDATIRALSAELVTAHARVNDAVTSVTLRNTYLKEAREKQKSISLLLDDMEKAVEAKFDALQPHLKEDDWQRYRCYDQVVSLSDAYYSAQQQYERLADAFAKTENDLQRVNVVARFRHGARKQRETMQYIEKQIAELEQELKHFFD